MKDREELERRRVLMQEYQRWLAEFPQIALVLDNMEAAAVGKEWLCASRPPSENGPWTIEGLREVLRQRTRRSLSGTD